MEDRLYADYSNQYAEYRMECVRLADGDLAKAQKLWSFVSGPAPVCVTSSLAEEGQLTPHYEALKRIWSIADGYHNSTMRESLNEALVQIREIANVGRAF